MIEDDNISTLARLILIYQLTGSATVVKLFNEGKINRNKTRLSLGKALRRPHMGLTRVQTRGTLTKIYFPGPQPPPY